MGTIVKRIRHGKPVYQVRIRSNAGTASATFDKLGDAKDWASRTEADIRRDVHTEKQLAKEHTLGEAIDGYLASPKFRAIVGQVDRKAQLEWWRKQYGHLSLAAFGSDKIAEGRDKLIASGRAPATANRYLAGLSACLKRTVREARWITINPCGHVDRALEDNARDRVLTKEEQQRLIDACRGDLRDLVVLALGTAARRGELVGIKWDDVDLANARVVFTDTKAGGDRRIALVGAALDVLKARSKVRRLGSPYVFPSKSDPKKPAQMRGAFEGAVQRAGLGDFVFHQLRHTALTDIGRAGASLTALMAISGHRTLAMVERYQHGNADDTAVALERMTAQRGGAA